MEKIHSFHIIRLTIAGFKCFVDKTAFDFGEITHITAANGKGKSSIADAIAYAFTGTPFFGDRGLDRLQNDNSHEMEVTIDFEDDAGGRHILTRSRKRGTTAITLDGFELRQADMTAIFGEKDLFLSIINPLYFIDVLGDSGKYLLEKLLPMVSHEDVLSALSEHSREILKEESLLSPETYIKNRRAEICEFEESLISYKGQRELLEYQRQERATGLAGLESRLAGVVAEITELEALRDEGRDSDAEAQTLAELRAQRDELRSAGRDAATDNDISVLQREIGSLEASISARAARSYQSPFTNDIIVAEAKLKALYAEHKALSDTIGRIVADVKCPTCMTVMTDAEAAEVKQELGQKIAVLVVDGKKAKADMMMLRTKEDHARSVFEASEAGTLSTMRSRLDEMHRRLQELIISSELDALGADEQVMALESRINELEYRAKHGNLLPKDILRLDELQDVKRECEAKLDAINNLPVDYDFDSLIFQTEADISRLKRFVNEAVNYAAARAELMLAGMRMNRARIVLSEIVKSTGEVKDCFKFSYEGRDYKCLSLSEKIKAGLEVSELIQRLAGKNYPVFIDNGESICAIDTDYLFAGG
jgi:hypothetical protein